MLRLFNPTGYGVSLGSPAAAVVTVTDNDPAPSLQFAPAAATVKEAAGAVALKVTRTGSSANQVTVDYATSSGTATAGSDFTATAGTLTFDPTVTSQIIPITILTDATWEASEAFTVALSNPGPGTAAVLGAAKTATLTITDDDQAVMLSSATYTATEGGKALITVKRVGGVAGTITLNYATSDGSARTVDGDFTATTGLLSFGPGISTQTFGVQTTKDTSAEGSETVNLTLSAANPATALGSPSAAVLTVLDSSPVVQFSAAKYTISEPGNLNPPVTAKVSITVKRTGVLTAPATVQYATSPGTTNPATAGSDYTTTAGTLSFKPGIATQSFAVTILSDVVDEPAETVNLTLTAGGLNPLPIGTPGTAVLTINDNDTAGKVQFSSTVYSVAETAGTATITVTRTMGTAGPSTVQYATSNGTATAGSDYTAAAGTLTFGPGETSKTFAVPILDDALAEPGESVNLTLSSPSYGLALGTTPTAVLWIVSNE